MQKNEVCPRCGSLVPNNVTPGEYPGALSRKDNDTEICSECGMLEAMEDLRGVPYNGEPYWNVEKESQGRARVW